MSLPVITGPRPAQQQYITSDLTTILTPFSISISISENPTQAPFVSAPIAALMKEPTTPLTTAIHINYTPESTQTTSGGDPSLSQSCTFTTTLPADWCIGVVPHGGYLASLLLKACMTAYTLFTKTQPTVSNTTTSPLHLTLSFLRKTSIGPASITIIPLKLGSGYSFLSATLTQSSLPRFVGIITLSHSSSPTFGASNQLRPLHPLHSLSPPPSSHHAIPPRTLCIPPPTPPSPAATFVIARSHLEYLHPPTHLSTPGIIEQWVRWNPAKYPQNPTFGALDLGYLGDMYAPLPEILYHHHQRMEGSPQPWSGTNNSRSAWYPTLTYQVEFKQPPPPTGWEWLFVRVDTKGGVDKEGRFDESVEIYDERGGLVAVAGQVGLVVEVERNLGGLKAEKKQRIREAML